MSLIQTAGPACTAIVTIYRTICSVWVFVFNWGQTNISQFHIFLIKMSLRAELFCTPFEARSAEALPSDRATRGCNSIFSGVFSFHLNTTHAKGDYRLLKVTIAYYVKVTVITMLNIFNIGYYRLLRLLFVATWY